MAPEVVSTALRAVRTRFWVPLLVPFVSKVHEASQWALEAVGQLDASGVAWFVGRLASVHRATAR